MPLKALCVNCGRDIIYTADFGWAHQDGYVISCEPPRVAKPQHGTEHNS